MGKANVLIVDDSRTTRGFLKSILENAGYTIDEAEDGAIALEKISNRVPDLMILDMLMPNLDGIDVLEKLRDLNISFPIVVLTADIQDQVKDECYELGAVGFLNKPASEEDIIETIQKALS